MCASQRARRTRDAWPAALAADRRRRQRDESKTNRTTSARLSTPEPRCFWSTWLADEPCTDKAQTLFVRGSIRLPAAALTSRDETQLIIGGPVFALRRPLFFLLPFRLSFHHLKFHLLVAPAHRARARNLTQCFAIKRVSLFTCCLFVCFFFRIIFNLFRQSPDSRLVRFDSDSFEDQKRRKEFWSVFGSLVEPFRPSKSQHRQ